ncbi:hypothetical protein G3T14_19310 [Methylobacterium sp. BTF04]|uniref:hypothetical protein n=1 Tax=Methylobacterium sp. BTF04 TaxID=2708300 RepID=UPI0013D41591|nr:hypothetical protein [Methylobacterium sp. BTF04]NEU14258.1 hypothetical protein [Methylobacterium sp. BTF04]
MGANRRVQVGLASREADARNEPLTFTGDEADECDRGVADVAGEQDDVVETLLGRGVEDILVIERRETGRIENDDQRRRDRGCRSITLQGYPMLAAAAASAFIGAAG